MEDVPPSYQSAIDREAWNVIAPWIPSSDLCSTCLVCRKWHGIFVPFLWGDPASHFGIENDEVYVALTRFKRTLRKARHDVRQLTHTLHLPPAVSEIYGGPNPSWLREILEYLPNLQSLIVSRLPFFDHHSLLVLHTPIGSNRDEDLLPEYGLKLLLAASEPNVTSVGLAAALPRFPNLVYLDLSYTTPARDASVLSALSTLHDLQVLKLRGVGMRDGEAEVLANAIGIRVRLLDLRENLLTDMAVRSLLQACFLPSQKESGGLRMNSRRVEDWPVGMPPGPDFFSLDTLRNEDLDHELLKQLTSPLTGRLAFEDIPHRGLTHLYIADNRLSVEGLSSLLKSERLHILDGGSVDTVKTISRTRSLSSPSGYTDEVRFPGAEKLIPVLADSASKNLTYLRVDHAVVTKAIEASKDVPMPKSSFSELAGSQSLSAELPAEERHIAEAPAPAHFPMEMPTEGDPIFELDASPPAPKYELPGDIIHFAISPPVGEKPGPSRTPSQHHPEPVKGDGAFAPEAVTNGDNNTHHNGSEDEEVVLNASGSGLTSKRSPDFSPLTSQGPLASSSSRAVPAFSPTLPSPASVHFASHATQPSSSTARLAHIDLLVQKRPRALAFAESNKAGDGRVKIASNLLSALHPAVLPNLRTLILTGVPTLIPQSSPILPALKNFISACADEDALAHLRAQTNYSLPPGRARKDAEMHHARSLFALRQIIFEMAQPGSSKDKLQTKGWTHLRQRISMSKSSTGDRDSENMWTAASEDFSFFGEEGEEKDECGIYQHDPDKYFPTAHMDDKIVLSPQESREERLSSSPNGSINSLSMTRTVTRSPTVLRSPRELPLGRNRRGSSEASRMTISEAQGSLPTAPTSNPVQQTSQQVTLEDEPMIELISELAKWRKERRLAYEQALFLWRSSRVNGLSHRGTLSSIGTVLNVGSTMAVADEKDMPFVEGHWRGDIKVIRNPAPKGRTGIVDMYGNYFEKGYLYP